MPSPQPFPGVSLIGRYMQLAHNNAIVIRLSIRGFHVAERNIITASVQAKSSLSRGDPAPSDPGVDDAGSSEGIDFAESFEDNSYQCCSLLLTWL